jgi:hypothetical protein
MDIIKHETQIFLSYPYLTNNNRFYSYGIKFVSHAKRPETSLSLKNWGTILASNYAFLGVLANFHEHWTKAPVVRSPDTSDIGTASSISFKSSLLSFTLNELILLSRFFILVVPTTHDRLQCHICNNKRNHNWGF